MVDIDEEALEHTFKSVHDFIVDSMKYSGYVPKIEKQLEFAIKEYLEHVESRKETING